MFCAVVVVFVVVVVVIHVASFDNMEIYHVIYSLYIFPSW